MQRSARFRLEFIKELPVQESMRRLGIVSEHILRMPIVSLMCTFQMLS